MEMIYSCVMGCEVEYEPPIDYDAYDDETPQSGNPDRYRNCRNDHYNGDGGSSHAEGAHSD